MSDYISREALIGKVEKHYCAPCKGQGGDLGGDWCRSCVINSVLEKVRGIPAADVAPVRHERWVSVQHKLARVCSVCNRDEPYKFADIDADVYDYCPNCGAKMDKEEADETERTN